MKIRLTKTPATPAWSNLEAGQVHECVARPAHFNRSSARFFIRHICTVQLWGSQEKRDHIIPIMDTEAEIVFD